ncbi:MAG: DegV family protein [Clostridia bacterium]|nr:DegV family protein [Clostridia bacterium]
MKIAVSAESTIDCPKELLEEYDIRTLPYTVILGNTEAQDGVITPEKIFEFVKTTNILPKTSAINEEQYGAFFKDLLKDYDAVVHFTLSKEISSAYSHAVEASKKLKNVYVISSDSLSTGIALLAIKARELDREGKSLETIVKTCSELTSKVSASFILDKLDYLHKGGRCSGIALLGANLFSIKPQIVLSNGKMIVGKKFLGKWDKLIGKYCEETLKNANGYDLSHAFITYTTASPECAMVARKALEEKGFKNIHETHAGATITSHCGPNTLGILFIKA